MNKTLKQLIEAAKQFSLTPAEKAAGTEELRHFIKTHPVSEGQLARQPMQGSNSGLLVNLKNFMFKPIPVFIILVLLIGGGTALAAEQALPGDTLYPVKVKVNEPVRGWLALSAEARANWEAQLATRRLEEGEDLVAQSKLDAKASAQVESNFQAQAERVQARIAKFSASQSKAAADVAANLETSLQAHDRILLNISNSTSGEAKLKVDSLLGKVRAEEKSATSDRTREENEVKSQAKVEVQAAAEGRLQAAQNKLAEVRQFITAKSDQLGAAATAQAEARLTIADNLLTQGQAKLESNDYAAAFSLFGQARAAAQETKLLIEAKGRLEDEKEYSTSVSPSPSASATMPGEAEEEGNVQLDGRALRGAGRGKIKIDLGL